MLMALTYWMLQSAGPQGGNAQRDIFITASSGSELANACFARQTPHWHARVAFGPSCEG